MKAQTAITQIAILGGIAVGAALCFRHSQKTPAADPHTTELNRRIRAGILPIDTAVTLFAENARYVSEARWLLSADPFEQWKVAWMGLSRDVDFNKKYEHGFVVIYDEDKRPLMALHTMPNDRSGDPLPNAMGDRDCVIDVFAVTMDASGALRKKRGHDEIISDQLLPLSAPAKQATALRAYIGSVHEQQFNYTVPIQPVKRELMAALRDDSTLIDFNGPNRVKAVARRKRALGWIENRSDASLASWLNPATKYRLGAIGFNSNSGAADIMAVLGHKHSLNLISAPFCDQSMLTAIKARAAISIATITHVEKRQVTKRPIVISAASPAPAFA